MLRQFGAVWRMRRVLLIREKDDAASALEAWLTILGARCTCISPQTKTEVLYRTLTAGRTFAVIACSMPKDNKWLFEIHETGVPLTIICPAGDTQDAALRTLQFGVRFIKEGLPCGVYNLNHFS